MSIAMAMIAGGGFAAAYTGILTVGHNVIGGKGFASSAYGFGTSGSPYGAFGSIAPTSWRGFPIVAIYQADSAGTTIFEVTGNATAFSPAMTVGGVNQSLGVGSFGGGITTFTGAATDPFIGQSNVNVAIS